ncbi:MAG TPA: 3-ketoacyl-ACP reductase [Pirellulales bacterium]|nr:3-ketoacyl-ACP reductase [Pirellulales bacterium]
MSSPVALVTGGSRGIGRASCLELAGLGYATVVNYAHNQAAADECVAQIRAVGGQALAVQADVASSGDRERLVTTTLEHFGRLDVLVNNAGITSPGRLDLLDATEESWERVMATNLKGPFFLTQLAAREMLGLIGAGTITSGKIIHISSISAYAVSPDRGDYCLAKAAMRMLTWLWADRLAAERIQVFELCPGIIATDMTAPVQEKYDRLLAEGLAPMRRWGRPEDVARAIAAIVSDYFPYSTGQRIDIDGGFHIRRL